VIGPFDPGGLVYQVGGKFLTYFKGSWRGYCLFHAPFLFVIIVKFYSSIFLLIDCIVCLFLINDGDSPSEVLLHGVPGW